MSLLLLFCALDVQAQQDYWKGQVKDAVSGEPMIGVSVRVKGTGSGTITDFDGNFTVKASKGDILVFLMWVIKLWNWI